MAYGGGIEVASAFTRKAAVPTDDSSVVADNTARDALPSGIRYLGMEVYVTSTKKKYRLEDGLLNANWKELAGGAATNVYSGVTASITAFATGGQASAVALTSYINQISVCATDGDSVKLPAAVAGAEVLVINDGAKKLSLIHI